MFRNVLLSVLVLVGLREAQSAATTAAPNCGSNPADIVFLLDSSGSVGSSNFQKQLDFVKRFAQTFDIGPRNVQIGAVTFASTPHNEFNLNTFGNKHDLLAGINKINYHTGGTRTDLALKYVEANSFRPQSGDRSGVANILIVMTDGRSNMPQLTTAETAKLHQMNIKVFAIGIGSGVDKAELGRIASDSQHVFQVQNFDALNTLQAELKKTACQIDGGWTKWGSYSPCTKSCGGGTQFRERSCTNPRPANGGAQCVGKNKETHACNTKACPTPAPTTTTTTPRTTPVPTTPACNSTEPADIVFILDASGSVGATNFQKMLDFVKKMVDGFPISATETHVGVITFDSKTYLQFHLNKYNDKNSIKNAISKTRYTSGTTHTAEAIKYAREISFSKQNGARPNAAKIAIIVTDGQSANAAATASEAKLLRNSGVTVFSIGVGSGAKVSELNSMATDPDKTHVFQVTNFNSLNTIKGTLQKKTCEVKVSTVPPTTSTPKPQCDVQADIVFLLDSSGSVGSSNFQKTKDFVKDVANSFKIGPNAVQIGVDTFQSTVKSEFNMNKFNDKNQMLAAINGISYKSGSTHTGEAIRFMRTNSFTAAAGDRPNIPNLAIVVTDGNSNNAALTKSEAQKLRQAGTTVLAIGVGSGISKTELNAIATDPDNTHVFTADNFDALKSLKALLSTKACEVSKPAQNATAPRQQCAAKADIVFILDSSGSIGQSNYNKMLSFVKDVTSNFDIGKDKIRVGLEIFSDRTFPQFNLNQHYTSGAVATAISNIPYKRGTTNTGQSLKDAYGKMFTQGNGDRPGVPNIAIVVTDGRSNNRPNTLSEAKKLRDSGVQVFAVGVGSGVDKSELNGIATDPDNTHVLTVQDFTQLNQITATLKNKACDATTKANNTQTGTGVVGPTIVSSNDPCQDQNANCGSYDIPAICQDYAAWARDNCNRSCGFCTPSVPTTPPPCVNAIKDCPSYSVSVCSEYRGWAEDNCRQFCGFCQLGSTSQVLTGFFGKCYYNGKQYSQGQTWDDGCAYECSCENAQSGRYSCYNKCPLYHNLPPQCTLIKQNPTDCCLSPVCDFKGTHLTTNGQTVGTYNGVKVCMYKGSPYYQGQTWQDGCEYSCICEDAQTGRYSCQSVCAQYTNLPTGCTLVKPAGKCCEEPSCTFNKQYGQFTGSGTSSGKGTGSQALTTATPCVDKDPNCSRYPQDSCTNPTYQQWANDQCRKTCNLCNVAPTPGPNDVCIYKGVAYKQGQRWQDGCDLECVCENAMYGYYRCNKKCAEVVNLPLGCQQVKQAGDCCPKVQCTGTSSVFTGSQTVPGTIGGNVVAPPLLPTPAPGQTVAPGLTPAPGQVITGSLNGCFYKGVLHQQGDRWNDGCQYTCVCESGNTGQYKCSPKCPVFNNLPPECTMQDNPSDPCCKQPKCTPGSSGTLSVVPIPTYGKGFTGYGRPVMPSIGTGTGTGSGFSGNSGVPTAITGTGTGCVYKGKVYTQGQTWDDGCTYRCTCVDATNRQYQCTDRCVKYQNLPPQCQLQQDPNDNCCQTPKCDFTKPVTTMLPVFPQTTPSAGAAFCQYQGYYHRQGESWNDGCGLTCRCEDAANHYYQCTDRCPRYNNVPSSCTFVPDPRDPQCCTVPSCQGATGTGIGGSGTQGFTGSFVGYGKPPSIDPNSLSQTGYSKACLYKGQVYQQGDTWQDGCDYECECTDATTGRFRCTERCQRIANVPTGCTFTQDPNDACCQTLKCDPQARACADGLSNCNQYGTYVCTQYKDWAQTNCPKYCGFCGNGNQLATSAPGTCSDSIPNCSEYGNDPCVKSEYRDWALANCRKTCNLCNAGTGTGTIGTGTGGTGTGTGTIGTGTGGIGTGTGTGGTGTGTGTGTSGQGISGTGTCSDVLTNCPEYGQTSCQQPYVDWARKNCPAYCGYCGSIGSATGTGSGGFSGFQTVAPGGGSFTGFSGGCVYKGRYYPMGDKWQDGCDFNCTCENGQTGFFRCIPRCPNYQLAAGCVLKKNPGECCGVPDCSGATGTGTGGTGTGGTGTGTGIGTGTGTGTGGTGTFTGDQPGCFYKNQLYQEGQQWKDGCKYKCTCISGATHQYSCTPICLTWNLPSVCTLNPPAAGKCCETPNCPPSVVINYPAGYTPE